MCKHAVKNLPIAIRYVSDRYTTQQMCDKAILENYRTLEFVSDNYKVNKCVIKLLTITLMH